jgi:predicted metalloprotease with PDZ domain
MLTHDFQTPLDTDLLWVYEGLTQYLGELIEARSGLMDPAEFRNRLSIEVRQATYQQGRQWRSLQDTAAASHLLRDSSAAWSRLRRSQDYYMEGMLFWLEADAIIRSESGGAKSLDDFCQAFFACSPEDRDLLPKAFTKEELIQDLNNVVKFDWQRLIQRRIEMPIPKFQPEVVERLGLAVQYSNEPDAIPDATYRSFPAVDAYDSIGCAIGSDGMVKDLLLGSAADQAALGPGMKIIGVNDHAWSVQRMQDAIAMSATRGQIDLMVVNGDSFHTHVVKYDGGPRYMVLKRQAGMPDLLSEILKPRE